MDELLESGTCICGSELVGEARETLEAYKTQLQYSEFGNVAIEGKIYINKIFDEIKAFPEEIDELNQNISESEDRLDQKKRRIEQINETLADYDIEKIQRYQARHEELKALIIKNEVELKGLNAGRDELEKTFDQLKIEEENEIKKISKNKELNEKLDLVRDTLRTIANTIDKIKSKIRNTVERDTDDNFKALIRKKTAFEKVTIDENYNVRVTHKDGYNVINNLSAGEYLILGMSFMSALMSISGFKAPVIIDTPLGKIDDEHREYITTELPKFLKGIQMLLLVTPTEFDSNVQKNLEQYLVPSNFYRIIENEDKTESKVVPYVS